MAKITFRTNTGDVVVDAKNGETLLEAAINSGVDLFGGCGGAGVCGSCHVFIDPDCIGKIDETSAEEQDLIDVLPNGKFNSRLACQIEVTEKLDGLIVIIP